MICWVIAKPLHFRKKMCLFKWGFVISSRASKPEMASGQNHLNIPRLFAHGMEVDQHGSTMWRPALGCYRLHILQPPMSHNDHHSALQQKHRARPQSLQRSAATSWSFGWLWHGAREPIWFNVVKTNNNKPSPSLITILMWYVCHSQSWIVYGIVLTTLPSGKHTKTNGNSQFFMGKSTISMAMASIVFCLFTRG